MNNHIINRKEQQKKIYYGTAEITCELRKAKYFSYKKHKWNTEQSNKY